MNLWDAHDDWPLLSMESRCTRPQRLWFSSFSTVLELSLHGMYSHTQLSGTGVSTRQDKEQRWGSFYKRDGSNRSCPLLLAVWREACRGSASPISATCSLCHHGPPWEGRHRARNEFQDKTLRVIPPRTDCKVLFPYKHPLPVLVCLRYGLALPPSLSPNT